MTGSKSRPNRLREHREAAGLTQQELADAVGAGRVTIVRAEQGSQLPSLELADRLADVLDTSIDLLFSDFERDPYEEGRQDGLQWGRETERKEAERTRRVEPDTPADEDQGKHASSSLFDQIAAFITEIVTAKPSAPGRWKAWWLPNPRGTRRKLDAVVTVEVERHAPREAARLFKALSRDEDWGVGDDTEEAEPNG